MLSLFQLQFCESTFPYCTERMNQLTGNCLKHFFVFSFHTMLNGIVDVENGNLCKGMLDCISLLVQTLCKHT